MQLYARIFSTINRKHMLFFNIDMASSLIFKLLAPTCLGMTGQCFMYISVVPTNAHANRALAWYFHPGLLRSTNTEISHL